jgi:hypothetical protein
MPPALVIAGLSAASWAVLAALIAAYRDRRGRSLRAVGVIGPRPAELLQEIPPATGGPPKE